MRTLSSALLTELGLTVTRPGYLVELGYSTVVHISTMGDISWNSQTWTAMSVKVSGLGQDGSGGNTAKVTLGNTNNLYGALVLNEGASDIPVRIWVCYAGATALGDPVQVFGGVTDGAAIDQKFVTLDLVSQNNLTLYSPRVFINKSSGFNFLQPTGTKIYANGETFVLERPNA